MAVCRLGDAAGMRAGWGCWGVLGCGPGWGRGGVGADLSGGEVGPEHAAAWRALPSARTHPGNWWGLCRNPGTHSLGLASLTRTS